MYHTQDFTEHSTPSFSRVLLSCFPESFSRTPMPPEDPTLHLGAGHLSQVSLSW